VSKITLAEYIFGSVYFAGILKARSKSGVRVWKIWLRISL